MNTKDLMERIKDMSYTDVNEIIQKLAQPDIVYCEDCKWCLIAYYSCIHGRYCDLHERHGYKYCSKGVRKND